MGFYDWQLYMGGIGQLVEEENGDGILQCKTRTKVNEGLMSKPHKKLRLIKVNSN